MLSGEANYEYESRFSDDSSEEVAPLIPESRGYPMDQPSQPTEAQTLQGFNFLFIVTELVGAFLIILTAVWTLHFRGGFAWKSDPAHEFNWHPLLMIIGFVFLYANGMLIYRTQRNIRKKKLKLLHAGIMISCIFLTVFGLVAAFDSHNLANPPKPNMYTLHSWVGLTSVILFCCQWVAGLVSFLYPGVQGHIRAAYMPVHVYFGIAGFVGAIAACLIGLNEKAIWATEYAQFPTEGVLMNIIGMTLIVFGGLSVYLVTEYRYKRLPKPEDDFLLTEGRN